MRTAAFSDEELTALCFDRFRLVHEQFSAGMSKLDKIQRLVEHCDRHSQMDELVSLIAEHNPDQYALFAVRVRSSQAPEQVT